MRHISLSLVLFSFISCVKNGDCHYEIDVINNSSDTIIFAYPFNEARLVEGCFLDGTYIPPGDTFPLENKRCWEYVLTNGLTEHFFLASPQKFNEEDDRYSCDSFYQMNDILVEHNLTLPQLKENDFQVFYP